MLNAARISRNKLIILLSASVMLLAVACKKKDCPQSAVALIHSFKFNKADNPILPQDIDGVRVRDTFYVALPSGITERSLV